MSRAEEITSEVRRLVLTCRAMEAQLQQSVPKRTHEEVVSKMQGTIDELDSELARMKIELEKTSGISEKIAGLTMEISSQAQTISSQGQTIDAQGKTIEALAARLSQETIPISMYHGVLSRVSELEDKMNSKMVLREDYDSALKKSEELAETISSMVPKSEYLALQSQIESNYAPKQSYDEALNQLSVAKEEISQRESNFQLVQTEFSAAKEKLSESDSRIKNFEANYVAKDLLTASESKVRELEAILEVTVPREQLALKEARIFDLEATLTNSVPRDAFDASEVRYNELKAQLSNFVPKSDYDLLNAKLSELSQKAEFASQNKETEQTIPTSPVPDATVSSQSPENSTLQPDAQSSPVENPALTETTTTLQSEVTETIPKTETTPEPVVVAPSQLQIDRFAAVTEEKVPETTVQVAVETAAPQDVQVVTVSETIPQAVEAPIVEPQLPAETQPVEFQSSSVPEATPVEVLETAAAPESVPTETVPTESVHPVAQDSSLEVPQPVVENVIPVQNETIQQAEAIASAPEQAQTIPDLQPVAEPVQNEVGVSSQVEQVQQIHESTPQISQTNPVEVSVPENSQSVATEAVITSPSQVVSEEKIVAEPVPAVQPSSTQAVQAEVIQTSVMTPESSTVASEVPEVTSTNAGDQVPVAQTVVSDIVQEVNPAPVPSTQEVSALTSNESEIPTTMDHSSEGREVVVVSETMPSQTPTQETIPQSINSDQVSEQQIQASVAQVEQTIQNAITEAAASSSEQPEIAQVVQSVGDNQTQHVDEAVKPEITEVQTQLSEIKVATETGAVTFTPTRIVVDYALGFIFRNTGFCARSGLEFLQDIEQVPLPILENHMRNGDFENWFRDVFADNGCADSLRTLRESNVAGEELRTKIAAVVAPRYKS